MKKEKLNFYEKQQKMVTFVNNDKSRKSIISQEPLKGKSSIQTDKSLATDGRSESTDPNAARRGTIHG